MTALETRVIDGKVTSLTTIRLGDVMEKGGARGRIRTGEPLQEQILSLSPLTRLGNPRI